MRTIIEEFTEMIKAVSDRSTNLMEARFFEYNIPNAKKKLERARTKLRDAIVDLQTTNERAEARAKKAETALFVTQEDLETAVNEAVQESKRAERAEARIKELEAQLSAANHALVRTIPWMSTNQNGVYICKHCGGKYFTNVSDHAPECAWMRAVNFVKQEKKGEANS